MVPEFHAYAHSISCQVYSCTLHICCNLCLCMGQCALLISISVLKATPQEFFAYLYLHFNILLFCKFILHFSCIVFEF